MTFRFTARPAAVLGLALLAFGLAGCRLTRPVVNWLTPDGDRYRIAAAVCTAPEDVRSAAGALLGVELTVIGLGDSCRDAARRVFVSVGAEKAFRKARRLGVHDQVVLIGVFDGRDQQTLIVHRLRLRR